MDNDPAEKDEHANTSGTKTDSEKKKKKHKSRRSSILKPPKQRNPLKELDFTAPLVDDMLQTTLKSRRVSFASNNLVKEFATDKDKTTIWNSTYEESLETGNGSSSHASSQDNATSANGGLMDKSQYLQDNLETSSMEISGWIDGEIVIRDSNVGNVTDAEEMQMTRPIPSAIMKDLRRNCDEGAGEGEMSFTKVVPAGVLKNMPSLIRRNETVKAAEERDLRGRCEVETKEGCALEDTDNMMAMTAAVPNEIISNIGNFGVGSEERRKDEIFVSAAVPAGAVKGNIMSNIRKSRVECKGDSVMNAEEDMVMTAAIPNCIIKNIQCFKQLEEDAVVKDSRLEEFKERKKAEKEKGTEAEEMIMTAAIRNSIICNIQNYGVERKETSIVGTEEDMALTAAFPTRIIKNVQCFKQSKENAVVKDSIPEENTMKTVAPPISILKRSKLLQGYEERKKSEVGEMMMTSATRRSIFSNNQNCRVEYKEDSVMNAGEDMSITAAIPDRIIKNVYSFKQSEEETGSKVERMTMTMRNNSISNTQNYRVDNKENYVMDVEEDMEITAAIPDRIISNVHSFKQPEVDTIGKGSRQEEDISRYVSGSVQSFKQSIQGPEEQKRVEVKGTEVKEMMMTAVIRNSTIHNIENCTAENNNDSVKNAEENMMAEVIRNSSINIIQNCRAENEKDSAADAKEDQAITAAIPNDIIKNICGFRQSEEDQFAKDSEKTDNATEITNAVPNVETVGNDQNSMNISKNPQVDPLKETEAEAEISQNKVMDISMQESVPRNENAENFVTEDNPTDAVTIAKTNQEEPSILKTITSATAKSFSASGINESSENVKKNNTKPITKETTVEVEEKFNNLSVNESKNSNGKAKEIKSSVKTTIPVTSPSPVDVNIRIAAKLDQNVSTGAIRKSNRINREQTYTIATHSDKENVNVLNDSDALPISTSRRTTEFSTLKTPTSSFFINASEFSPISIDDDTNHLINYRMSEDMPKSEFSKIVDHFMHDSDEEVEQRNKRPPDGSLRKSADRKRIHCERSTKASKASVSLFEKKSDSKERGDKSETLLAVQFENIEDTSFPDLGLSREVSMLSNVVECNNDSDINVLGDIDDYVRNACQMPELTVSVVRVDREIADVAAIMGNGKAKLEKLKENRANALRKKRQRTEALIRDIKNTLKKIQEERNDAERENNRSLSSFFPSSAESSIEDCDAFEKSIRKPLLSLKDKVLEQFERNTELETICWEIESLDENVYTFKTLNRTVTITAFLSDCVKGTVEKLDVQANCNTERSHIYGLYAHHKFKRIFNERAIASKCGATYTILTLLDYLDMCGQEIFHNISDFEDYSVKYVMQLNERFHATFQIISSKLSIVWEITIDLSDDESLSGDSVTAKAIVGTLDNNAFKKIVNSCPKGKEFLKRFMQKLDEYVNDFKIRA